MSYLELKSTQTLRDWCQLWPELAKILAQHPLANLSLQRLCHDSRLVRPGDIFFALQGTQHQGAKFIQQAWQQGAICAVIEGDLHLEQQTDGWLLQLPNLRAKLGQLLAASSQAPLTQMLTQAITGTNGKSSIAHYLCQLWQQLGVKAALIGTLGLGQLHQLQAATLTTPDLFHLHQIYAEFAAQGIERVAIEASSHALQQQRLDGLHLNSAIFTNLSHDHLDYHGTLANYALAKQKLFTRPEISTWVLNLDDATARSWLHNFSALTASAQQQPQIYAYSLRSATSLATEDYPPQLHLISLLNASYSATGIQAQIEYKNKLWSLHLPLLGEFNLANILATLAALLAEGWQLEQLVPLLANLQPVPGRMQKINSITQQQLPKVVVDYAHTPDALKQALKAARQHCQGKLWCVFGCGGNRDTSKRAFMGAVAQEGADICIVTDDNPRYEDPHSIRQAILAEAKLAIEIPQRQQAIETAIQQAHTEDWILIAGKGHETWQEIAGERHYFDDTQIAKTALQLRLNTKQQQALVS